MDQHLISTSGQKILQLLNDENSNNFEVSNEMISSQQQSQSNCSDNIIESNSHVVCSEINLNKIQNNYLIQNNVPQDVVQNFYDLSEFVSSIYASSKNKFGEIESNIQSQTELFMLESTKFQQINQKSEKNTIDFCKNQIANLSNCFERSLNESKLQSFQNSQQQMSEFETNMNQIKQEIIQIKQQILMYSEIENVKQQLYDLNNNFLSINDQVHKLQQVTCNHSCSKMDNEKRLLNEDKSYCQKIEEFSKNICKQEEIFKSFISKLDQRFKNLQTSFSTKQSQKMNNSNNKFSFQKNKTNQNLQSHNQKNMQNSSRQIYKQNSSVSKFSTEQSIPSNQQSVNNISCLKNQNSKQAIKSVRIDGQHVNSNSIGVTENLNKNLKIKNIQIQKSQKQTNQSSKNYNQQKNFKNSMNLKCSNNLSTQNCNSIQQLNQKAKKHANLVSKFSTQKSCVNIENIDADYQSQFKLKSKLQSTNKFQQKQFQNQTNQQFQQKQFSKGMIVQSQNSYHQNKSISNQIYYPKFIKLQQYTIIRTQRLGNCLYESISLDLFKGQIDQSQIRKEISQYLELNSNKYKDFIEDSNTKYLQDKIMQNGEYACEIILRLVADCYKKPVLVYKNRFYQIIPEKTFIPDSYLDNYSIQLDNSIKLLFTGKEDGGHFDVIVKNDIANDIQQQSQIAKSNLKQNVEQQIDNSILISCTNNNSMNQSNSIENIDLDKVAKMNHKSTDFYCGCKIIYFKSFKSLQNHYYRVHGKSVPQNSSHDIKGVKINKQQQNQGSN